MGLGAGTQLSSLLLGRPMLCRDSESVGNYVCLSLDSGNSLTMCGTLALEGGPIAWVATHRMHHQNADKEGDPHSPCDGGTVGAYGLDHHRPRDASAIPANCLPYVPDLRKDKFHLWISKWHVVPSRRLAVLFYSIGGWPCAVLGVFVRSVMSLHFTWLVNSATHMWGSQRFETGDDSSNSFWVAMLSIGDGWHNNHHSCATIGTARTAVV